MAYIQYQIKTQHNIIYLSGDKGESAELSSPVLREELVLGACGVDPSIQTHSRLRSQDSVGESERVGVWGCRFVFHCVTLAKKGQYIGINLSSLQS